DILNCIGASMMLAAPLTAPRRGRPQIAVALIVAAVFVALGALVGRAPLPRWLPRPLTSSVGGQQPMAWFTLFPQFAWVLVGIAIGHWRVGANADRQVA